MGCRGALERHQVTAFFVLAYGFSWLVELVPRAARRSTPCSLVPRLPELA
jgi:hypothetical protein